MKLITDNCHSTESCSSLFSLNDLCSVPHHNSATLCNDIMTWLCNSCSFEITAKHFQEFARCLQLPGVCWVCKWALNKLKKVIGPNATAEVKHNIQMPVCRSPCARTHSAVLFDFTERDDEAEGRLRWEWPLEVFVPQICEGTPRATSGGTHYHWWCEDDLCQHSSLQVSQQPIYVV